MYVRTPLYTTHIHTHTHARTQTRHSFGSQIVEDLHIID